MNKDLLKQIMILSLVLGIVLGILTAIPFIGQIAFFILICLVSAVVIVFLSKLGILDVADVKESVVLGSIVGFVSFLAFCVSYIPIMIIFAKGFHLYSNYGVAMMLGNAGLGMIIVLSLFMAILSATINAFTGFVTYYIMEFMKTLKG